MLLPALSLSGDNLFFNPHSHIGAAGTDIDPERGHVIGQELRQFGLLEEQHVAFLHGLQMVQGRFDMAHVDFDVYVRITHSNCQIFTPDFVRFLIAIAGGHAVAQ